MVTHARLRRRTEQRLIAGVAGGIADRLNASAGFIRVLLAFACFWALDWVLAAYAIGALLIPPRGSGRPDWDNVIGLTRLGVLVVLPVFGDRAEITLNEPFQGPAGWWIAYYGLLAAGAVALLTADYRRERPRTRDEARAVVLAAAPVVACFMALGAALFLAPDVRWERLLPIASLVGAGALLVATRRRSAAAFLAPAMLAMGMVGVAMAADARLQGGVGGRHVTPSPAGGAPIVVRRAIGDLSLDLRRITRNGRDAVVDASVGVGALKITVPRRARVELDASVGKGSVEAYVFNGVDGRQGFDQRIRSTGQPQRARSALPTIRVRAQVGLGEIDVDGPVGLVPEES